MGQEITSLSTLDQGKRDAFLHSLTQSVVGIVGKDDGGNFGAQIGTGTLIERGGQRYVLTANHVIRGCTDHEVRFLLIKHGVRFGEFGQSLNPCASELFEREPLAITSRHEDARLDVAALQLEPSSLSESFWSFRSLNPVSAFRSGQGFVLMGFPSARAVPFDDKGSYVAVRTYDYPQLVDRGSRLFTDFDDSCHVLATFPSEADFNPHGYSGSALWLNQEHSNSKLWTAVPKYGGMVLGYYKSLKLFRAISAASIIQFLDEVAKP